MMRSINFLKNETLYVLCFLAVWISFPLFAAPNLDKNVELIADKHYFRQQAIELLYDKKINYEKAFSCKKLTESVSGSRLDAVCAGEVGKYVVTLTVIKAKNGYAAYVLVCPAGFDQLDPYNITPKAFKKDKTNFDGYSGYSYYMGRTDGWIKDFENIFLTANMGFTKMSCWGLNKR